MKTTRTICWFALLVAAACGGSDAELRVQPVPPPSPPPPPSAVVGVLLAGVNHTCGLGAQRTLYCWGGNDSGQLGNGSTEGSIKPVAVASPAFGTIAAGGRHTCGSKGDGLFCWGDNSQGQLGDTTFTGSAVPVKVTSLVLAPDEFRQVAAGGSHTCMLSWSDIYCWGSNSRGQLGVAEPATSPLALRVPQTAANPYAEWLGVTAGHAHSCALQEDGTVFCWGDNSRGQLGNGSYSASAEPRAVPAARLSLVVAGGSHTCGLVALDSIDGQPPPVGGAAVCWGANGSGQLGNATVADSASPVRVDTPAMLAAISAGGAHTCAIAHWGPLYCWGSNAHGQLGNGTTVSSSVPVLVTAPDGVSTFWSVVAGEEHTCAKYGTRTYCWGRNTSGQLGNGVAIDSHLPVLVETFK